MAAARVPAGAVFFPRPRGPAGPVPRRRAGWGSRMSLRGVWGAVGWMGPAQIYPKLFVHARAAGAAAWEPSPREGWNNGPVPKVGQISGASVFAQ